MAPEIAKNERIAPKVYITESRNSNGFYGIYKSGVAASVVEIVEHSVSES